MSGGLETGGVHQLLLLLLLLMMMMACAPSRHGLRLASRLGDGTAGGGGGGGGGAGAVSVLCRRRHLSMISVVCGRRSSDSFNDVTLPRMSPPPPPPLP